MYHIPKEGDNKVFKPHNFSYSYNPDAKNKDTEFHMKICNECGFWILSKHYGILYSNDYTYKDGNKHVHNCLSGCGYEIEGNIVNEKIYFDNNYHWSVCDRCRGESKEEDIKNGTGLVKYAKQLHDGWAEGEFGVFYTTCNNHEKIVINLNEEAADKFRCDFITGHDWTGPSTSVKGVGYSCSKCGQFESTLKEPDRYHYYYKLPGDASSSIKDKI